MFAVLQQMLLRRKERKWGFSFRPKHGSVCADFAYAKNVRSETVWREKNEQQSS